MLGSLAKWLRILGYDALYCRDMTAFSIFKLALSENRIIITRNKKFKHYISPKVIMVNSTGVIEQLKFVAGELRLDTKNIFTRCSVCNTLLETQPKENIKDKVPEYIYNNHGGFAVCPSCKRIYWPGTHTEKIMNVFADIGMKKGG